VTSCTIECKPKVLVVCHLAASILTLLIDHLLFLNIDLLFVFFLEASDLLFKHVLALLNEYVRRHKEKQQEVLIREAHEDWHHMEEVALLDTCIAVQVPQDEVEIKN